MMGRTTINVIFLILTVYMAVVFKFFPLSKDAKLSLGYSKATTLNFTEAAAENRYESEEHTVVTEDGYILTIFRITKSRKCQDKKRQRPVLLMHGVMENSDIFLDAGPSAGLAYLLSDDCYDVWAGNQRGNNYARQHLRLNPDKDADFWKFSADEIGFYDVPATIDYVLKTAGVDKLNYVGFSQGCGIYFTMCSERPGYCDKAALMVALAPAVFLEHAESTTLLAIFKTAQYLKGVFELLGVQEVLHKDSFWQVLLEFLCQFHGWTDRLCVTSGFLDNYHVGSMTADTQKLVFSHFFVGTSLNNLIRYAQLAGTGDYKKLDYEEKINLERYNNTKAPDYNLGAVSVPVLIIQGRNDKLINIKDVQILASKLPNVVEIVEVSNPQWTHFDMLYNKDIKKVIYPKISTYLHMYSEEEFMKDL